MTQEPIDNETIMPEEIRSPIEPALKKKRTLLWIIIGVGVVLLLGGAAFLAGRFFNNQNANNNQNGPIVSTGPNGQQSVRISPGDFSPWPTEIPQTEPDTEGLFISRQDNVLTIGTGNATIAMKRSGPESTAEVSTSYSGPQVAVVVSGQTKIYRDASMDDLTNGIPQNGQKIQRKVADGSLDDLTTTSNVIVWGRKTGDRYVADVLIYSTPLMVAKPNK